MKIFTIILNLAYIFTGIYSLTIDRNILNFGLSVFCLAISLLISFLTKKSIIRSNSLGVILNSFVFFSVVLGTIFEFYDLIKGYDDFLHVWSGFIGVAFAYNILLVTNDDNLKVSKLFVIIYLFMFSMGVASIWEIVEFLLDSYLNMSTQAGGLPDTMIDMIDGFIGSFIMILYYKFSWKRQIISKK